MTRKLILAVTLAVLGLASSAARADSIIVTLDSPVQIVHPGDTEVDFFATITADAGNAGPLYFNSDAFSIGAELTLDDTGLFFFFPSPMYPGESHDTLLFSIFLSGVEPAGSYLGTFFINGGADFNAQTQIGSVNFEIENVGTGMPSVPEPSTLALCGTGVSVTAGSVRRKWRKA